MTCPYLEPTGFEEFRCRISGTSVLQTCGTDAEASDEPGESLCVPRQALEHAAGRFPIDHLRPSYRDAIRSVLARMQRENVEVSIVTKEQNHQGSAAPAVASLSDAQLSALRAEADREIRDRKMLAKKRPELLARFRTFEAALSKKISDLTDALEAVKQGIADLEAGRLPNAEMRRRVGILGMLGRTQTPEARAQISAARKATLAAKRKTT